MDAASGQVFFERSADEQRPPASMTKLMTLRLVSKALAAGQVRWDEPVAVSEEAYRTEGAQIWLEPGEQMPFGQLVRAIAIASANDACVAVAEHLAGSIESFAKEMNAEARRLGLRHTHFANPHGLDDPEHYTSARDMALLARQVLKDPRLVKLLTTREDRTIRNGKGGKLWLVNHNRLIGRYPGILGLKTGFTNGAGYCLTSAAKRQNLTLISVVMGLPTSKERFGDATSLLNWGFSHYEAKVLFDKGKVLGQVPVLKGEKVAVGAVPAAPVTVTLARGDKSAVKTELRLEKQLKAPFAKGVPIGEVAVYRNGKREAVYPLTASEGMRKVTWDLLFKHLVRRVLHAA